MTTTRVVPVKGTAAPTISRVLGMRGVEDYTVGNCGDYVSVRTRRVMQVKNALDAHKYVYTYMISQGSAAFHVKGRRVGTKTWLTNSRST